MASSEGQFPESGCGEGDAPDARDEAILKLLRGTGDLRPPSPRAPLLLRMAVQAIGPVIGGCAGAVAGGAEGGLLGVVAAQATEKLIGLFCERILERWMPWMREQPPEAVEAALKQLSETPPLVVRIEAASLLHQEAPQAAQSDLQAAIDFLSAMPRSVRQSLQTDSVTGERTLPPAFPLGDRVGLLRLLPRGLPPYAAPTTLPGTDYQLEELIGIGGFGAVYRARQPSLQYLPLAIKFCLNENWRDVLLQEQAVLERLIRKGCESWSPRLVRLYGYDLDHRTPYLVYEYVPGGDLARWLADRAASGKKPTPDEVLGVIVQVVEALAFAHGHGLVHRDLKPANVLRVDEKTIKLADFGIGGAARRAGQPGTFAASELSFADQPSLLRGAGTPLYADPEQKQGMEPDPRHDLYSLAVMWYQLLVGDAGRAMPLGWERELESKCRVPAKQIELLGRCVGLIEDRPRDARQLLQELIAPVEAGRATQGDAKPKANPAAAVAPAVRAATGSGTVLRPIDAREKLILAEKATEEAYQSPEWRGNWTAFLFGSFPVAGMALVVIWQARAVSPETLWYLGALACALAGVVTSAAWHYLSRLKRADRASAEAVKASRATLLAAGLPALEVNNLPAHHLRARLEAHFRLAGVRAQITVDGFANSYVAIEISVSGRVAGKGTMKNGCYAEANLCCGTHRLTIHKGENGPSLGEVWFYLPRGGPGQPCQIRVTRGTFGGYRAQVAYDSIGTE